ncbi:hypothetical protein BO94DRAFT_538570 [Aspergillus sclerotioniger CBS 115572]|uniref:Uncharacterized protein n=1 Tax=Aspergillus sclerotioniger CBS 115572 TaxID=1450535 RepID=A0A317VPQ7_9EURO|nr:hypothetical protein BO94DRAFT_538570 [Aspergillus sclerotioniger CBS 115572]PWY75251.1 hypothetical protein BO94DRAFT_538570 [Aspergillus sclerotioniger CBS 115572]
MSLNSQPNPDPNRDSSLKDLEGTDNAPKTISPEDRAALTEALTDQTNITLLTEAGRSSQREREQRRKGAGRK